MGLAQPQEDQTALDDEIATRSGKVIIPFRNTWIICRKKNCS